MSTLPLGPRGQRASPASTAQPEASRSSTHVSQNAQGLFRGRFGTAAIAEMKAVALDILHTIIAAAADVAGDTSVPGLRIGLLALAQVIEKIQTMQTVVEGVETLQQRVGSLMASLNEFREQSGNQQLPDGMILRIEALVELWKGIEKRAEKITSRGRVMRFLRSSRDAKKLGVLIEEINVSIQDKIMTQGILSIERYIQNMYKDIKAIRAFLSESFIANYAKTAHYNSTQVRRSCLKGTRVEVLQRARAWITNACTSGETIPSSGIVLWINGLGGTGKTTIAVSIAEWCDEHGLLGGTFFCLRSDNECSNPNLIFVTLCRQLCHRHAKLQEKVEAVFKEKPDIANCGPRLQFEQLILQPLEELEGPFLRLVIVLDALDECQDGNTTSTILSVIAKYADRISRFLLFVITSRPEQRITALFESKRKDSLMDKTTPLLLHDIPLELVVTDIEPYINHEFDEMVGVLGIEEGWPSSEERSALAELSHGLFIYVATAIRFIMDEAYCDPKGQLRSLLTTRPTSSTPQKFLFTLYSKILIASYERTSPELAETLRHVLGTIVIAQELLSPLSIARLVDLDVIVVRNSLSRLHSVLHVPADDHQPIRIIHPTFPEFLLQPPTSTSLDSTNSLPIFATLHLQPAAQHWYLCCKCIDVMSSALRRDMIGIRYPAMFRGEVENFEEKVRAAIGPHVSYACRFWDKHLRGGFEGGATSGPFAPLKSFIHTKLMYWLEACSLLDAMDKVTFMLDAVMDVCQIPGSPFEDLAPVIADCRQFVVAYSRCIHTAPLQVYYSTLSIAPSCSRIRDMYAHEREHALIVDHGLPSNWGACLDSFPGRGRSAVITVEFSPDGSHFVTGSADFEATIWKTTTRTPVGSFVGHTGRVLCVIYSPDGHYVASGSDDCTICVWSTTSGELVHTLIGHIGWVNSVVYSGDGRRIVSATYNEGEMKLWNTTDGQCLCTIDGVGYIACQVAISFDGGIIARGEGDSLRLYDAFSSHSRTLEFPDVVEACTFSPDGRFIAARSWRTLRVWACEDWSLVRSIDSPDDLYSRLAFSPDATFIACGSSFGSLYLWQLMSDDPPYILPGRSSAINDVACSPDRSQVISVTDDGMIQVWDLAASAIPAVGHLPLERPVLPSPPPTGPPRFALIWSGQYPIAMLDLSAHGIDATRFPIRAQMPDGAPTATLFPDVVSAWSAALKSSASWYGDDGGRWTLLTGKRLPRLSWRPFAISPDNSLMAYPSPASGGVVAVCDLRTGAVVATMVGHTEYVSSIAFSPDSTRLATGSWDNSVKVWDALTGTLICSHAEHLDQVCALAFSPDGLFVASGSVDRTARIFEVATERIICVLGWHRSFVMQMMFAEDNIHLVALDLTGWVCIWDITTGACIREFSLQYHDHPRHPIFSPDDTGIIVSGDDGELRSVSLWRPGTRNWPAFHVTDDGWVYAVGPDELRRLCWFPSEWRTVLQSDGGTFYVGEAEPGRNTRGKIIILRVSHIRDYIESLDASL